jgi:polyhydroxybutyrate depolymerase
VQGDADTAVPLSEGTKARDYWRRVNQCKATTKAYDPSPCVAYDGCARSEIWCQIPGMGHTIWPENGAKVTWAFLASLK